MKKKKEINYWRRAGIILIGLCLILLVMNLSQEMKNDIQENFEDFYEREINITEVVDYPYLLCNLKTNKCIVVGK